MIPTNAVQAVNSVRNGDFGLPEQIKIGEIIVDLLIGLEGPDEKTIVSDPVQAGFEITKAAIKVPFRKTLSIILTNPDYGPSAALDALMTGSVQGLTETWRDKKDRLYGYFNDSEIIEVITQESVFSSVIIESINPIYDVNDLYDCFQCDVVIREYQTFGDDLSNATDAEGKLFGKATNVGRM